MHYKRISRVAAATAAALIMSGCVQDISHTLPPATSPAETEPVTSATEKTTTSATTTAPVTTTTITTTEAPETEPDTQTAGGEESPAGADTATETYKTYIFSDEYNDFISQCVFVGDSICRGLKAYSILPASQVLAQGNVAVRSIFDYTFKVGSDEMSILAALVDLKPKYIVFSMGMNDVNITSEQTYCDNYRDLLSQVQSFLPDATLIVLSITPTTRNTEGKFVVKNEYIDSFNKAIKEYLDSTEKWFFADVSHDMKNSENELKSKYLGSEDGVHLTPDAYSAILYQLCERMVDGKIYDPETGETEKPLDTTDLIEKPAETTKQTSNTTETEDLLSGAIQLDDDL